jgi:phosphatidylinositol glycan class H protein
MFSGPTQFLEIYCPSPTTVSFTVDTRQRSNSRQKLLTALRYGCRILLVLYVLLVNGAKAQSLTSQGSAADHYANFLINLTLIGQVIRTLAEVMEWWVLGPLSLVVLYACLKRDHTKESLLVLQGLGIQTSTSSPYFFLPPTTTFIPTTQVQDIVIHEAFIGLEVRFYLAVIVENATEVVVVFPVCASLSPNVSYLV